MDRRSNAAWVSPQAVKARRPPRSGKSAAPTLAGPRVMRAGFALPRDAGRRPALHKGRYALWHGGGSGALVSRSRAMPVGDRRGTHFGHKVQAVRTLAWRRVVCAGFALPRDAGRRPALQAVRTLAWRRVVCAGFALPRDAGRRPALQAVRTLAWRRVRCAGFALPRDAGRRPALQAVRTLAWRRVRCAGFALPRDAGRRPALLVLQKRGRARRPAPKVLG